MKLILLLVDALRSDYVTKEYMPYSNKMKDTSLYINKVVPSCGYCERSEIFTGATPINSGYFTAIGFDQSKSEYKLLKPVLSLLSKMPKSWEKYTRYLLRKFLKSLNISMKPYHIPFNSLKNFYLTEDFKDHDIIDSLEIETIIDIIIQNNKTYNFEGFTTLRKVDRIKTLKMKIEFIKSQMELETDFIPVYIGDIDMIGHVHTGEQEIIEKHLLIIDNFIKDIVEYCDADKSSYSVMVLGDHGMMPVRKYIDIQSSLTQLFLKLGKDYEVFIDSTIIRFWFYNANSKEMIINMLQEQFSKNGQIVDDYLAKKHNIPLNKINNDGIKIYGDLIWIANPGVVISPDYFNKERSIKGMHGYASDDPLNCGTLLLKGKNIIPDYRKQCHLNDICPTICEILKIPYPQNNEGNSLISNNL